MNSEISRTLVELALHHLVPLLVDQARIRMARRAARKAAARNGRTVAAPLPLTARELCLIAPAAGTGVTVESAIPGRVRLTLRELRGAPGLASAAEDALRELPGVRRVSANTTTGRILVEYDPARLTLGQVRSALEAGLLYAAPGSCSQAGRPTNRQRANRAAGKARYLSLVAT
jgi:hypothetical protein